MRFKGKKSALIMLMMLISLGIGSGVSADTESQISDLENEISDNEAKYEEIQNHSDESLSLLRAYDTGPCGSS